MRPKNPRSTKKASTPVTIHVHKAQTKMVRSSQYPGYQMQQMKLRALNLKNQNQTSAAGAIRILN
jgi:hypothetical protein